MRTNRVKKMVAAVPVILSLVSACAVACTSFAFPRNGHLVFGTNYDNRFAPGLIFVNPRNVKKSGFEAGTSGAVASWVAKYGSITFTCAGYQLAWAGMNEKGLVLSTMELEETVDPAPDERPPLLCAFWMQYLLDTCATVDEVIRSDRAVRITSGREHYLVCDRRGGCAVIEFLDGKMVCFTADGLPVRALGNRPYAVCAESWRRGFLPEAGANDSIARVTRAGTMMAAFDEKRHDAAEYAFRILGTMRDAPTPELTRWSIVFDTGSLEIHYISFANPRMRRIAFRAFDFDCGRPVKMLEVHNDLSGDISGAFRDYAHDRSLEFLLEAVKFHRPDFLMETLPPMLQMMENFPCLPHR